MERIFVWRTRASICDEKEKAFTVAHSVQIYYTNESLSFSPGSYYYNTVNVKLQIFETISHRIRVLFLHFFHFFFFFRKQLPPEIYRTLPMTGNACWTVRTRAIGVLTHRNIVCLASARSRVHRTGFVSSYPLRVCITCIRICIGINVYAYKRVHKDMKVLIVSLLLLLLLYARSTGRHNTWPRAHDRKSRAMWRVQVGENRSERGQPHFYFFRLYYNNIMITLRLFVFPATTHSKPVHLRLHR